MKIEGKEVPDIPKQRPDEDAMSYVERLEAFKRSLPDDLLNARVPGVSSSDEGIIPWTRATHFGTARVPEKDKPFFESPGRVNPRYRPFTTTIKLPEKPRKRTPQERMEHLCKMLMEGLRPGQPLPRSIVKAMTKLYREQGIPKTEAQVEREAVEGFRTGLDLYAKSLLNKAARGNGIEIVTR